MAGYIGSGSVLGSFWRRLLSAHRAQRPATERVSFKIIVADTVHLAAVERAGFAAAVAVAVVTSAAAVAGDAAAATPAAAGAAAPAVDAPAAVAGSATPSIVGRS